MLHWFLNLPILDGPVLIAVYTIAAALFVVLIARKPTKAWLTRAFAGMATGAIVAMGVFAVSNQLRLFDDVDLPAEALYFPMAAFAAVGLAIVSLWKSHWWRKIIAVLAIVPFVFAGIVGVNVHYGLNPTIGSIFGVAPGDPIVLPGTDSGSNAAPNKPLYETWQAPADMPATGTVGTQMIPATKSGFQARDASIYLPPAALVKDAPALPLLIFMMGYPGNPDPTVLAATLNSYAAQHNGLAPIAIVADQIGTDGDPACADSKTFGNAETYITQDVAAWAKANLNIIDDARYWTIGGYSNGGGCAIKYGAKYPQLFKNIIDISGEVFPGSLDPNTVTKDIYGGDAKAFEAAKTVNILAAAKPGTFAQTTAVFTAGSDDAKYTGEAQTVSAAAKNAGMTVYFFEVSGAGHVGSALSGGLMQAIAPLYPVWGLAAP